MIIIPAKFDRCVKKVEESSPNVNPYAVCQTTVGASEEENMDKDMLVYPKEFKQGMKEELEHKDITGGDKETTKKIVIAHLKEDPKYYSKLTAKMKAEYDPGGGGKIMAPKKAKEKIKKEPIVVPGKSFPKTRSYLKERNLLAEEEKFPEQHLEDPSKNFPHPKKKDFPESTRTVKKAEEDAFGRGKPGIPTQSDIDAHNVYTKKLSERTGKPHRVMPSLSAEEEEFGMGKVPHRVPASRKLMPKKKPEQAEEEGIGDTVKGLIKKLDPAPKKIKSTSTSPLTKSFVRRQMQKAEEEEGIGDMIRKLDPSPSRPKSTSTPPLTKSFVRKQRQRAEEEKCACEDEDEKLSEKMIKKAEEIMTPEKVDEIKNQTIIEDYGKKAEEKAKPPGFQADPK